MHNSMPVSLKIEMVMDTMSKRVNNRKIFYKRFHKANPHFLKVAYAKNPRGGDIGGQQLVKRCISIDLFADFKLDNFTNSYNSFIFTNCCKDMANLGSISLGNKRASQKEYTQDIRFRSFVFDDKGYKDKIPHSGKNNISKP